MIAALCGGLCCACWRILGTSPWITASDDLFRVGVVSAGGGVDVAVGGVGGANLWILRKKQASRKKCDDLRKKLLRTHAAIRKYPFTGGAEVLLVSPVGPCGLSAA